MTDRSWKITVVVFLISWLSQMYYLFPVPDFTVSVGDNPIEAVKRTGWIISIALIVFGLAAGVTALVKRRVGLVLMLISGLSYALAWWAFSGYFDVDISLPKLFSVLWVAARASGHQFTFFHLDVVLLIYYHFIVLALSLMLYRRVKRS